MNKRQEYMEKVLALVMLAYAIALMVGEKVRDAMFGNAKRTSKWRRYSGAFILLKDYWSIPTRLYKEASKQALSAFANLVLPHVRTHV